MGYLRNSPVDIPDIESIYCSLLYDRDPSYMIFEEVSEIRRRMARLPSSYAREYVFQDASIEDSTPGRVLMAEIPEDKCKWWEGGEELIQSYIRILLELLEKYPHRYLPHSQIMLFIDNNGMIGFVPQGTQPGDTIWETSSLGSIVILRRTALGYKTVAKSAKAQYTRTSNQIFQDEEEWHANHPSYYDNRRWYDDMLNCHLTFVSIPHDDATSSVSSSSDGSREDIDEPGFHCAGPKRRKYRNVGRKRNQKKPRSSSGVRKGKIANDVLCFSENRNKQSYGECFSGNTNML